MPTLLLRNGRVIDPSQHLDCVTNLWLQDGTIIGTGAQPAIADTVIDCTNLIVSPGLIDMHVHLREPGREEDETIETGTAAAAAGGVTSVACMPNTEPAIATPEVIAFVLRKAREAGHCNVFPIAAVTRERAGKELADLTALAAAGAVGFTDDGAPVASAEHMRRALEKGRELGRAVLVHAEVPELTVGGVINEGVVSRELGLGGMPGVAEDIMIARDIILAELTGGRVHILHVSTAGGVDLIRQGIARGIPVSGEACPHHFLLTDESLRTRDSHYKMAPPLRTKRDVDAILAGLKDGTLSVLATDHAPHSPAKKSRPFEQTPNGILGLETFLPLCITHLVVPGHLTWPQMLAKMTVNPARVLGIDRGTLRPGRPADVTVIDPHVNWTIDAKATRSRSRNTPFDGWSVTGRAVLTIVGGQVKMSRLDDSRMVGMTPPATAGCSQLPRATWEPLRAAYLARVRPWVEERLRRSDRGEKHPVHDFLFEYYSFRPAHLLRWSPGANVILEQATPAELGWREFVPAEQGLVLAASEFPAQRVSYLTWAVQYLEATRDREPAWGCFGLHEWAMVYRDPAVRHPYVPLRLTRAETDAVIEGQALRCTHFDAYRFFTPAAVSRNRLPLTRETTTEHDQPGCLHVNMDLYRFAYKLGPFCPADLQAEAFDLARAAREIDMRASPYDLSAYGYAPVRIETREGREEYIELQRGVYWRSLPIRDRLVAVYRELLRSRTEGGS